MSLAMCDRCCELKNTDFDDGAFTEDNKGYLCEKCYEKVGEDNE